MGVIGRGGENGHNTGCGVTWYDIYIWRGYIAQVPGLFYVLGSSPTIVLCQIPCSLFVHPVTAGRGPRLCFWIAGARGCLLSCPSPKWSNNWVTTPAHSKLL